jgi:hypothetical protein
MIISFATGLIQFCELVLCAGGVRSTAKFQFPPAGFVGLPFSGFGADGTSRGQQSDADQQRNDD